MQTNTTVETATARSQSTTFQTAALVTLFLSLSATAAFAQTALDATITTATRAAVRELAMERTSDPRTQDNDVATGRWQQELNGGVDFLSTSAYVWRGFIPADRSVQTSSWVKFRNLTLSSWVNLTSDRATLTEHDFTADYTATRGTVAFSAGYINYVFPGASDNVSHELYVGAAHAGLLNPAVRVYQDIGAGSGTYISASASHGFELSRPRVLVTPSIALGYNHRQWIDASTFSDLTVGVKAAWVSPIKRVTIAPSINYSKSLASNRFSSRLFWGLGLSVD